MSGMEGGAYIVAVCVVFTSFTAVAAFFLIPFWKNKK